MISERQTNQMGTFWTVETTKRNFLLYISINAIVYLLTTRIQKMKIKFIILELERYNRESDITEKS